MSEAIKPLYSPALRMKAGELEGVRQLTPGVADLVLPRYIVPPSGERDEVGTLLFDLERQPDISTSLLNAWGGRPALVDCTYILDEFGRERSEEWLPAMFEKARQKGAEPIPTALLGDIISCLAAFRGAIRHAAKIKFAIVLPAEEMVGPEFRVAVDAALKDLGIAAAECVVIADFAEAEFTNPAIVAPIVTGALETLQEMGLWRHIIFQGSNYPQKNPAPDDGVEFWPRNEWLAWRLAVKFDPTTTEQMIFGDYAADCSQIDFGLSGGRAIRHIRYTSGDNWRIQRGPKIGKDGVSMHQVYSQIARSRDFAGYGFSDADAYIARAAADAGEPHGNAQTWRQLNTTHHITHVIEDMARVKGIGFKRLLAVETHQPSMFLEG